MPGHSTYATRRPLMLAMVVGGLGQAISSAAAQAHRTFHEARPVQATLQELASAIQVHPHHQSRVRARGGGEEEGGGGGGLTHAWLCRRMLQAERKTGSVALSERAWRLRAEGLEARLIEASRAFEAGSATPSSRCPASGSLALPTAQLWARSLRGVSGLACLLRGRTRKKPFDRKGSDRPARKPSVAALNRAKSMSLGQSRDFEKRGVGLAATLADLSTDRKAAPRPQPCCRCPRSAGRVPKHRLQ